MRNSGTNGKAIYRGCFGVRLASSISISPGDRAAPSSTGSSRLERSSDSIQFEFFEYVYHHVLRQDDEWAAREWLREGFRAHQEAVMQPPVRSSDDRLPVSVHDPAGHA